MDSKTETVSDNDELIARFMGHQYDKKEFGVSRVLFKNLWLPPKYSTSWDWLMPVVEKYFEDMNLINDKFLANLRRGIVERAIWDALYKRGSIADVAKTLANEIRYLNSQSHGHN